MSDVPGPSRRVALALDALRHGWPIAVTGKGGSLALIPIETGWIDPAATMPDRLIISAARAATLKLCNQADAASPDAPVQICGAEPFDAALARAIADPALDLDWPMKGPFRAEPLAEQEAAVLAVDLARRAGILPAYWVAAHEYCDGAVSAADLASFADPVRLTIQARARLPVSACASAEIVAFRSADDLREHVALIIGEPNGDSAPLVRLHSECLTGDVLGSLKCDCGPQLDHALQRMAAAAGDQPPGWGVLLYLRQEGRGIGLINKLRAYGLQDQGFDTVDANHRLGFPTEARDFAIAARMLALLGVTRLKLLTNNPAKVEALIAQGVEVTERVAHSIPSNPHNADYLETKRKRTGHLRD